MQSQFFKIVYTSVQIKTAFKLEEETDDCERNYDYIFNTVLVYV